MAEASRRHPLAGRRLALTGISMKAAPESERLSLRAAPEALAEINKALGLKLPTKPKKSTTAKQATALWLGPDEWLVIGNASTNLANKLQKLGSLPHSAVDVSQRNTAILIEGQKVEEVLNAGCPQDLSPVAFPVGACSRTVLAKAEIVLLRLDEHRFRLECWRSFSDYVWNYLADAATSN